MLDTVGHTEVDPADTGGLRAQLHHVVGHAALAADEVDALGAHFDVEALGVVLQRHAIDLVDVFPSRPVQELLAHQTAEQAARRGAQILDVLQHPFPLLVGLGTLLFQQLGLVLVVLGLPEHALVCERHVGVGMTKNDIRHQGLPLPPRDMLPVSMEEQIICYADKFYSKNGQDTDRVKSVDEIVDGLKRYGEDKVARFRAWAELFEEA